MTLSHTPAPSSVITGYLGASGSGLGIVTFGSVATPSPADDDVAGSSANTIVVTEKRFDSLGAIWVEFSVSDDGIGTSEFQVTETVTNNSGTDWIGYQVMVGFGTESGWVHSPIGDDLDFDMPDDNSPRDFDVFSTLAYSENTIDAVGGIILAGDSHTFTYAIDVPNGITTFSIRTSPREMPIPVEQKTWGMIKTLYR